VLRAPFLRLTPAEMKRSGMKNGDLIDVYAQTYALRCALALAGMTRFWLWC
jgi:anaerobic selenocysteine-containing dehydrogenase